jgi:multifunctional methyltransferase subunit TRM112
MRLLTHNSLKCPAKGIPNSLPLLIEITEMDVVETDVNASFMKHVLPSLSWEGLLVAANAVNLSGMPASYSADLLEDNDFIEAVHRLLIDIQVKSGFLVCQESGKRFPIENGVPDMR